MLNNIKYYVCNKYFVALLLSLTVCYGYYYYLNNDTQNDENEINYETFVKLFIGSYVCSLILIFAVYKFGLVDKYCPSFLTGGGSNNTLNPQQSQSTQNTQNPQSTQSTQNPHQDWTMATQFNTDIPMF